jgi:hypothetical protein
MLKHCPALFAVFNGIRPGVFNAIKKPSFTQSDRHGSGYVQEPFHNCRGPWLAFIHNHTATRLKYN